jgi:hypothetical protein
MTGRGGPPEHSHGGGPDGEDEYRAVVFDESFVRAAELHEPTAQERLRTGRGPQRLRRVLGMPAHAFRLLLIGVVVVCAMSSALYLGARAAPPAQVRYADTPAVLERVNLQAAGPDAPAPGADPFAGSPAAAWADGAAGLILPDSAGTTRYSAAQAAEALRTARAFVTATQLDPEVLAGTRPWASAERLSPAQRTQLLGALDLSRDDGLQAAVGFVTRFDPLQLKQADPRVKVNGRMAATEPAPGQLTVTVDAVFVYALKNIADNARVRFTVHRVWEFQFDHHSLREGRMRLRRVRTEAGPQSCAPDSGQWFRPVTAPVPGPLPGAPAHDPFRTGQPATAGCGTYAVP